MPKSRRIFSISGIVERGIGDQVYLRSAGSVQGSSLSCIGMRVLAVTNMYPTPEAPASGVFVEQQISGLRRIGLEVNVMFVDRKRKGTRVYTGLGRRVRERVRYFEPSLVHVMYGGVMAREVTRGMNGFPTVVTFHGSDLLGEHLSGTLRKWIAGIGVRASWKAAQRASGVVVVSKRLRDALPATVDFRKVKIIPCGIDLERFRPLDRSECRRRLGWKDDYFHVSFASSGDDPVKRPALARASVETANQLGVRAQFHLLRGVPNSDVPVWLNASDVLLLTSLHEGSPTIIKEALACDLPVVSVDVGDVGERIDGIQGCYLAQPDPEDLAAKLKSVYEGLRRVRGRARMRELCLERIACSLSDFYQEVLINWHAASTRSCPSVLGAGR